MSAQNIVQLLGQQIIWVPFKHFVTMKTWLGSLIERAEKISQMAVVILMLIPSDVFSIIISKDELILERQHKQTFEPDKLRCRSGRGAPSSQLV